MWPGAVGPGPVLLWDTPASNAARSNPTLGVRRGGQRERGTSGRWQPSPARRG
jgi:hypothetical protein